MNISEESFIALLSQLKKHCQPEVDSKVREMKLKLHDHRMEMEKANNAVKKLEKAKQEERFPKSFHYTFVLEIPSSLSPEIKSAFEEKAKKIKLQTETSIADLLIEMRKKQSEEAEKAGKSLPLLLKAEVQKIAGSVIQAHAQCHADLNSACLNKMQEELMDQLTLSAVTELSFQGERTVKVIQKREELEKAKREAKEKAMLEVKENKDKSVQELVNQAVTKSLKEFKASLRRERKQQPQQRNSSRSQQQQKKRPHSRNSYQQYQRHNASQPRSHSRSRPRSSQQQSQERRKYPKNQYQQQQHQNGRNQNYNRRNSSRQQQQQQQQKQRGRSPSRNGRVSPWFRHRSFSHDSLASRSPSWARSRSRSQSQSRANSHLSFRPKSRGGFRPNSRPNHFLGNRQGTGKEKRGGNRNNNSSSSHQHHAQFSSSNKPWRRRWNGSQN